MKKFAILCLAVALAGSAGVAWAQPKLSATRTSEEVANQEFIREQFVKLDSAKVYP